MTRNVIILAFLLLITFSIKAQISGIVKDAGSNEPVAGAVAGAVLDSVVVDAAIADADGRFTLAKIDPATFAGYINISCMGYADARFAPQQHIEARLSAESTELHEVSVTSQALRVESGKFISTPGAITQAVTTAWDVFAYTPLLSAAVCSPW